MRPSSISPSRRPRWPRPHRRARRCWRAIAVCRAAYACRCPGFVEDRNRSSWSRKARALVRCGPRRRRHDRRRRADLNGVAMDLAPSHILLRRSAAWPGICNQRHESGTAKPFLLSALTVMPRPWSQVAMVGASSLQARSKSALRTTAFLATRDECITAVADGWPSRFAVLRHRHNGVPVLVLRHDGAIWIEPLGEERSLELAVAASRGELFYS